LYLTGKAEAGSAGEQLARNNLSDWNGQWGGNFLLPYFLTSHSKSFMPLINSSTFCQEQQPFPSNFYQRTIGEMVAFLFL